MTNHTAPGLGILSQHSCQEKGFLMQAAQNVDDVA